MKRRGELFIPIMNIFVPEDAYQFEKNCFGVFFV